MSWTFGRGTLRFLCDSTYNVNMKTTNYFDTFIEVADDCPVHSAEIPSQKRDGKTVAYLQYELIINHPYMYTSDDVLFQVFVQRTNIQTDTLPEERSKFFSKGQPCFRSSPLAKRYGWGIHSNSEGKLAIYSVQSEEYKQLVSRQDIRHLKAMRSKQG